MTATAWLLLLPVSWLAFLAGFVPTLLLLGVTR